MGNNNEDKISPPPPPPPPLNNLSSALVRPLGFELQDLLSMSHLKIIKFLPYFSRKLSFIFLLTFYHQFPFCFLINNWNIEVTLRGICEEQYASSLRPEKLLACSWGQFGVVHQCESCISLYDGNMFGKHMTKNSFRWTCNFWVSYISLITVRVKISSTSWPRAANSSMTFLITM